MRMGPVGNAAGSPRNGRRTTGSLPRRAVGEHADQVALFHAVAQLDHRVDVAQRHDIGDGLRVDRGEHAVQAPRILLVHRHRHAPLPDEAPGGAQRFEAAEVRAHQHRSALGQQVARHSSRPRRGPGAR
jgi:hypothetical protein